MIQFIRSNTKFLLFWISTWCSEFSDSLRNFVLTYVILDTFGSNAAKYISFNLFFEYAPFLIFGFFVGVFVDRWDKKKSIIYALIVRTIVMMLIIIAIYEHSIVLILLCSFISAFGTILFRASQGAFTMQFVEKDDMKKSSILRQFSVSIIMLIGPAAATFFYITIGSSITIGITVVLFSLAILLISFIKVVGSNEVNANSSSFKSVSKELTDAFRYAKRDKIINIVLLANLMFGIGAGLCNVLMVFIITDYLKMPMEMFSVVSIVQGITMILCTLSFTKLKSFRVNMPLICITLMGFGISVMVLFESFYSMLAGVAILSIGLAAYNVSVSTLVQTNVHFDYQGRVSVITQAAWIGTMVITMIASGWLYKTISVHIIFLIFGTILTLFSFVLFFVYNREARSIQKGENMVG